MNDGTRHDATDAALWFDGTAIDALRQNMLRFARLQLRDATASEDAVQEALAAAYAARERFSGHSQLKTWVFAILRNKIIDLIRARAKQPTQSLTLEDGSDADINEAFDERGYWRKEARPRSWGEPEQTLEDEQFWRVFEICMDAMPESNARVFTMRELLGLDTEEICSELQISESNCWVILHRARSRLRKCLEDRWF